MWFDENFSYHDGVLPFGELGTAKKLESVSITFVPNAVDVKTFDDVVLREHPNCKLRLYRVAKGTNVSVLAGLTRIRRLKLELEPPSLDFVAALDALADLHCMVKRGVEARAIPWPASLRHLSLVADALETLEGLRALESLCLAAKVRTFDFLAGGAFPRLASLSLDGKSAGDFAALTRCRALQHVRVNYQAKVDAKHLSPLADVPKLVFLQLMQLPHVADLRWLGEKAAHIELTNMKGLKSLDWPGLPLVKSLGLFGPPARAVDFGVLTKARKLERFSPPSLLERACARNAALRAVKPGPDGEQKFRAAVYEELGFDSSYPK